MTPRLRTAALGVALILATNAVALGGAYYNRSGEPESRLVLSERELEPPYAWDWREENSGLSLRIDWRVAYGTDDDGSRYPYGRTALWIDQDKLAALGFDTDIPLEGVDVHHRYYRQVDRDALLVLELAGPAYQQSIEHVRKQAARTEAEAASETDEERRRERVKDARETLQRELERSSRLFVVDAGRDAAALRAKYPDRATYAIVRGRVAIDVCQPEHRKVLCGRFGGLEVSSINVPHRLRSVFEGIESRTYREPGPGTQPFTAEVAFGRRLEPWLVSAQRQ